MIEGSRARGRQRMKYIDSIKELLGSGNVSDVLRMAEDGSVGVPLQPMSTWPGTSVR